MKSKGSAGETGIWRQFEDTTPHPYSNLNITHKPNPDAANMVSDSQLIERLRDFLSTSDLNTTTNAILRRRLEEHFGIDLSDRKAFIREQVDAYMQSQFENAVENEGVDDEGEPEVAEEEEEEEELEEEEQEERRESSSSRTVKSIAKKRLVSTCAFLVRGFFFLILMAYCRFRCFSFRISWVNFVNMLKFSFFLFSIELFYSLLSRDDYCA